MCQLMRLPHIAVNMSQFPDGERLHSEQAISSQSFIRSKTRSRIPRPDLFDTIRGMSVDAVTPKSF